MNQQLTTVILAAGKGTRMKSMLPKVLNPLLGRPMIHWVIDVAQKIGSDKIVVVVGHQSDLVKNEINNFYDPEKNPFSDCRFNAEIVFVEQKEQLGTGHAVQQCIPFLKQQTGRVLILSGDVPLIEEKTLKKMIDLTDEETFATILTSTTEDPTGYGRIFRDKSGQYLDRIIEEKDLPDDASRAIKEVNCGIYLFDTDILLRMLPLLDNNNKQKEYYLPDVLGKLALKNVKVQIFNTPEMSQCHGVNTKEQLQIVSQNLLNRRQRLWPKEPNFIQIDNYLNNQQCQQLIDYFKNNVDQSTNVNNQFNGRVVYWENIKDPLLKTMMNRIHEDVALRLKRFYQEPGNVLPEATHIVKWEKGDTLGDHADNAYANGEPNYVNWRTYSAVIYLNDCSEFEDGQFYFRHPYREIKPQVGRLIAFTAGLEHLHGVVEVKQGTRYTMPMWFCGDSARDKSYFYTF